MATCSSNQKILQTPGEKLGPKTIKQSYQDINFSLKGPIYFRIGELEQELKNGAKKPFTNILKAHNGDSQNMGQKPNTFFRQVISAVSFPQLLNSSAFPSDVKQRVNNLLNAMGGNTMGSMTKAKGLGLVRHSVANFIGKRDKIRAESENIYLTNGVSGALELALKLVQIDCRDEGIGIMVPVPLFPLYSASITKHGLAQINYHLHPEDDWALETQELERAYHDELCTHNCTPRVLIVINPGNPCGKILSRGKLEEIVKFAYTHNLIIFADEVYQENILANIPFISIRKVLMEMGEPYNKVELISFFSISKGIISETSLRGGYMELINFDKRIHEILFKLLSLNFCPNVMGQVGIYTFTNPPEKGEASFESYEMEKAKILQNNKIIAKRFMESLNNVKGFKCSTIEGGSFAFIKITIPEKAIKMAESKEQLPDIFYGLSLLETFGVSVAVGSAFGLSPTQNYIRVALPPSFEVCERILEALKSFNEQFVAKYS